MILHYGFSENLFRKAAGLKVYIVPLCNFG